MSVGEGLMEKVKRRRSDREDPTEKVRQGRSTGEGLPKKVRRS